MTYNKMKPSRIDRKLFDIDLAHAEIQEELIAEIFTNKKLEVKTEMGDWLKTKNLVIEYKCAGKLSGISTTDSDFWVQNLMLDGELFMTMIFPTPILKALLKKGRFRRVRGGDGNASEIILLNVHGMFKEEIIKQIIEDVKKENN